MNKPSPNLDKEFMWLSDPAPSHEILIKLYFGCKTFKKRFEWEVVTS